MSVTTTQEARNIPKDPKENWTNLGLDGRKLTMIINQCFTKAYGPMRLKKGQVRPDTPPDLYFAYVDRMVKCMLAKEKLAITHLGVKQVLEEAKKR